jgi:Na+/melibiose symporter-like transporter
MSVATRFEVEGTPKVRTGLAIGRIRGEEPNLFQMLLLAIPTLACALVVMPLNIVMPAFYAANTTITLVQIGAVTTILKMLDAITNPITGFLSDRTKSRLGRRKPWVLAGGCIMAVAILFLFNPVHTAGIWYFGIASYFFYMGLSLFEIPRNAWTAEVTRDHQKRTSLNMTIAIMSIVGCLIFWITPIALSPLTGTTRITSATITGMSILFAIIMPTTLILAALYVSTGVEVPSEPLTFKSLAWSALHNRPLQIYTGILLFWNAAQGASLAMLFIYISDRLKLGDAFAPLMIGFFVVQIVTAPAWSRISARIGRHRAWAIGLAGDALSRPAVLLLAPGHALYGMCIIISLSAFFGGPTLFAPQSLLSDAVDYDFMRSGVNKAGNIFSMNTLLGNAAMALGGGGALILLGLMHYKIGGANGTYPVLGLNLAYVILPGVLGVVAATCAACFPIDAKRHATIRRRLEGRAKAPVDLKPLPAEI